MPRLPTELASQLGGVDRVAAIVTGTVTILIEGVLGLPHRAKGFAQDGDAAPFAIRADKVVTQQLLKPSSDKILCCTN